MVRIPREFIENILVATFGDNIKRYGDEWACPSFVKPWKNKLYVNVEKGTAYDFIEGVGYSGVDLIATLLNVDKERVLDMVIEWSIRHGDIVPQHQPKTTNIEFTALEVYPRQLAPLNDVCVTYLSKRGIDIDKAERYGLAFIPEHEENPKRDWGRLFLPTFEDGKLMYYQARDISGSHKVPYFSAKGVNKNFIVFNLDAVNDLAIITEGYFDALRVDGQCIFGNTASDHQVRKILAKEPRKIVVVPDNDPVIEVRKKPNSPHVKLVSPGYSGALKTIERLVRAGADVEHIYVAFIDDHFPQAKDLGDLTDDQARSIIENASQLSLEVLLKFGIKHARSYFLLKLL